MTDYLMDSGSGQLMMRDNGTTVECWVRAGYTNFSWDGLSFSWTANGSTTSGQINYPTGAPWYKVVTLTVTTSQTVTFKLNTATGTSSLGGPTTFSRFFDRGGIPDPPSAVRLTVVDTSSINFAFTDGDNNGLGIDNKELWYNNVNTTSGARIVGTPGSGTVYALTSGTRWYFWARTHNSKGWSGFSPVASAVTFKVPDAPSSVTYSNVTQSSVNTSFRANSNGGSPITAYELAYSTTNDVTTATSIPGAFSGDQTVTNLSAGNVIYFWARAQNKFGWGPWSIVTSVTLRAGAIVFVGVVPKRAVPYVKSNGVWKVAEGWSRNAGNWKQSAQ